MRRASVGSVLACLFVLAPAVPGWPQSNEGGIESDRRNEKIVRQLYDEFTTVWNHHDVKALAGMWAIDGDQLEPDGTFVKGRDAIGKLLTRQHETVFKNSELHLDINDVWFLGGGDIALVDGGYQLSGAVMPDGAALPTRRGHYTSVLLHENGRWWIAASRLMIPAGLPYKRP